MRSFYLRVKAPFRAASRDTERRDTFTRGVTASLKRAVIDIGDRARRMEEGNGRKSKKERKRDDAMPSRNVTNMVSQCLYTPSRGLLRFLRRRREGTRFLLLRLVKHRRVKRGGLILPVSVKSRARREFPLRNFPLHSRFHRGNLNAKCSKKKK